MVPFDPEGYQDHPTRDPRALASGGLSLLLALEIVSTGGRPEIETDLRALIRRMSIENPLWGAPRIHGELLKLGFEVAQSTVAKYMVKRPGPPSQGWRTFLRNHVPESRHGFVRSPDHWGFITITYRFRFSVKTGPPSVDTRAAVSGAETV